MRQVPTAYGIPCPECGGAKAEIEGWLFDADQGGHHVGCLLWCVSCEHRWLHHE